MYMGSEAIWEVPDPDMYPEPFKYKPERWLGDVTPAIHRNFVPFSKGSRGYLGSKYVNCLNVRDVGLNVDFV
jgi:hypothetical protein